MPPRWTIDAVAKAQMRCVIREPLEDNKLSQAFWTFHKSMEPMVKRNNLPSCFYSIIERGGA